MYVDIIPAVPVIFFPFDLYLFSLYFFLMFLHLLVAYFYLCFGDHFQCLHVVKYIYAGRIFLRPEISPAPWNSTIPFCIANPSLNNTNLISSGAPVKFKHLVDLPRKQPRVSSLQTPPVLHCSADNPRYLYLVSVSVPPA